MVGGLGECAVMGCSAGFNDILQMVDIVVPGFPRTSVASCKASRTVSPSMETSGGGAVWSY